MIVSIIQALFIEIQPNMSEQEKKRQRIWFALRWNQAKVSLFTIYKLYIYIYIYDNV